MVRRAEANVNNHSGEIEETRHDDAAPHKPFQPADYAEKLEEEEKERKLDHPDEGPVDDLVDECELKVD